MKTIRLFQPGDEQELAVIIQRCFMELNIRDYSLEGLRYWKELYTPAHVLEISGHGHMYVMEEDRTAEGAAAKQLLGTCSIVRKPDGKAFIEALYVSPDRPGEGIAKALLKACEDDPDFAGEHRLWVDSSITARTFYESRGYLHETGAPVCIDNDRYVMYKDRTN